MNKFLSTDLRRAAICALGGLLFSATASQAITVNDDCLAYGDCVVSGSFTLHPTLGNLGIWQAASPITIEDADVSFYGRTSRLSTDDDWSIDDQNGQGQTHFVRAGNVIDIMFGRSSQQDRMFQLLVDARFGTAGPLGEVTSFTVSNQPIEDAIITSDLRANGFTIDTRLSDLRSSLGLDASADASAIGDALSDVSVVPIPATGLLLLAGLGCMGALRRFSS